jgi:hypothetical protein
MNDAVGFVETKSAFYSTYKDAAGDTAEVLNEWLMNVVSATPRGAARGAISLRNVCGVQCLFLESHTLVGQADMRSLREMVSTGPCMGSLGIHNMKGIGTRLIQARLGGVEAHACELIVVTVDARSCRGAIARMGPVADKMQSTDVRNGTNMGRMAANLVFDRTTKRFGNFAFSSEEGGPVDPSSVALATHILFESDHPFQCGGNHDKTKANLAMLINMCMKKANDDASKVLTCFLYYDIGSAPTMPREPLLALSAEGNNILCNDSQLSLAEYLRECYVPLGTGLYPIRGRDDDDGTGGKKRIFVQKDNVFATQSFLTQTHNDPTTIKSSSVIHIDCGEGRTMPMLAYWPSPERAKGSDRMHLHKDEQYCTGTFLAYKDKILNAYAPKSLNMLYPGSDAYQVATTDVCRLNKTAAKQALLKTEVSPLRSWLGFTTWDEWEASGLPARAHIRASPAFDKNRLYEMLTCGAIFVVRIDQVASLNTQKDNLTARSDVGLSVADIVYRIRRAQVQWCLANKPQERLEKEAQMRERAASHEDLAAEARRALNDVDDEERRKIQRKRGAPDAFCPDADAAAAPPPRKRINKKTAMYDMVVNMARTPSTMLGELALRNERDRLIQLVAKKTIGKGRGASPTTAEEID